MEADETIILSNNKPSTSKTFSFFGKESIFVDVCAATLDFEKLAIDKKSSSSPNTKKKMSTSLPPVKESGSPRPYNFKTNRDRPYQLSAKIKKRRRNAMKKVETSPNSSDFVAMSRVVLEGDVEPLKLCLLEDRKDLQSSSCSVQAVRPPSPVPDDDVDELTEYFAHFVRVDLKMSALAESMYV